MTPYFDRDNVTIYCGDVLEVLRTLPAESVHCVTTSPPYWGLRDYGVEGQIGLEPTPQEFVAKMVEVFREVRRVLRSDGVLWLNLGDSYATGAGKVGECPGGGEQGEAWKKHFGKSTPGSVPAMAGMTQPNRLPIPGLKSKDLVGIPWAVAFALRDDGWYLRSDCIWAKPNPMPESVTDRPTKSHEYVFLLTKSQRYFYDADAVREPQSEGTHERFGKNPAPSTKRKLAEPGSGIKNNSSFDDAMVSMILPNGRNLRTVWTIPTQAYPGAHFATFPESLVERCLSAGTSAEGCCAECGTPWERVVEKTRYEPPTGDRFVDESRNDKTRKLSGAAYNASVRTLSTGWRPACDCNASPIPCTVLDPFGGSGTTAAVAQRLGLRCILIELNPEYCKLQKKRFRQRVLT